VKYEVISGLIEVFTCAVIAYGLSRFEFKLKKVLMVVLFLTILIPDGMLLLPRVVHYRHLDVLGILGGVNHLFGVDLRPNLIDNPLAFYLPALFGVGLKGGLFIFIYIQFFKGLPRELEDAAWIDGAGPIKTFLRIIIPSSGVVVLTVFLLSVVFHWNDYWYALMYTDQNRPLAYVVRNISQYIFLRFGSIQPNDARYVGVAMASCLLFIAPPTVMYLFLQRKFIQSIDRVGIVG
jgi:multiple sugar transport system permease protein